MWKTVLRRLLMMIPQIIILSVIAFFVAKMMPGDPFTGMIDPNIDPAIIEQKRIAAGYYDQYLFNISAGWEISCRVILDKVSSLNNQLSM